MEPETDLAEQVQKALVAHGAWKVRLAQAIETGSSEFSPAVVRLDDQCALGKWLHGSIAPTLQGMDQYQSVRTLHAQFHLAAGAVLETALDGRKTEARAAMEPSSDFARRSTQLTLALSAWSAAVGA